MCCHLTGHGIQDDFDEEPLTEEEIGGIIEALEDLKEGRIYTHDQVTKEFGIS